MMAWSNNWNTSLGVIASPDFSIHFSLWIKFKKKNIKDFCLFYEHFEIACTDMWLNREKLSWLKYKTKIKTCFWKYYSSKKTASHKVENSCLWNISFTFKENSRSQENLWKISNLKTLSSPQKLYNINLFKVLIWSQVNLWGRNFIETENGKQNETQVGANGAQV